MYLWLVLSVLTTALARPSSYAIWVRAPNLSPPTAAHLTLFQAADSAISRAQGNGIVSGAAAANYEHGEFQWALRLLYERTGNTTYYDYIKTAVDKVISSTGTVIAGYT